MSASGQKLTLALQNMTKRKQKDRLAVAIATHAPLWPMASASMVTNRTAAPRKGVFEKSRRFIWPT
jgi:hypothetical protein